MKKKRKYNKSKLYLLPLLSELVEFDPKFFKYLKNTFIFDNIGKYENCIMILHEFNFRNPEFTTYEHKLTKSPYFVDLIDIDEEVLYIFKFPDEYMEEYNHFINGKYSKYSDDAKELILEFYATIYKNVPSAVKVLLDTKSILFKEERLKKQIEESLSSKDHKVTLDVDAELSDIIDIEDETFDLERYEAKDKPTIKI